MCYLTKKAPRAKKEQVGYKIVAVKDGKDYSPATGVEYKEGNKKIKVPDIQRKIVLSFFDGLLNDREFGYVENMVGRTAVFLRKNDACRMAESYTTVIPGYQITVSKAKVSVAMLYGTYQLFDVCAGRKLELLEKQEDRWQGPKSEYDA